MRAFQRTIDEANQIKIKNQGFDQTPKPQIGNGTVWVPAKRANVAQS